MDETNDFDLVVVGAGAAGLIAAIRASELGARVLLVEKNRRPGVKILISGGTRCNITNARGLRSLSMISGPIDPAYDPSQAQGSRSIQQAFGSGGAFLGPALKALSVERTVELFENEGLATKVEGNGKVFPASDRAADVLDALLRRLDRSGATLRKLSPVLEVNRAESGEGFQITFAGSVIAARRVILALGGQSYPGCGTTGDGYEIARRFGHTILEPKPALVPIRVAPEWVPQLKGLTLPDIVASVRGAKGPALIERREALLFAHFGLTGPAILDVSRAVARHVGPDPLDLMLDLAPEIRAEDLDQQLQLSARSGRRLVAGLLPDQIPHRLAEALLAASSIPLTRMGPDLSRDERRRLVGNVKGLRLPITGTLGFAKAEVTSGGVALDEVNPRTLESRIQPGLYFAGEVLDLDGLIGGYNFQAAWSTGWLAAEAVRASTQE